MAKCMICDKEPIHGNSCSVTRSHISKRSSRTWEPNIKRVKALINGQPQRISVCTKCLRSGKVERA